MEFFTDILDRRYLKNEVSLWLIAGGIAIGVAMVMWALRWSARRRLGRLSTRHSRDFEVAVLEVVSRTSWWFMLAMGALAGRPLLELPKTADAWMIRVIVVITLLQVGRWLSTLVRHIIARRFDGENIDPSMRTGETMVRFLAVLLVWSLVLVSILANLGIDVTALVTGLGVGGVAVALALQNVLGDLFGSVSILLDKPFVVGDFIQVGKDSGTVERIGLKTTHLRGLGGEQIVLSNNDVLQSRVHNFKRMAERRVVFKLGVVYETPADALERIVAIVGEVIEGLPDVRFDRAHFANYGDFSLDFEIVYFVLSRDYKVYMDRQQSINLAIFRRFAEEGIQFAFPTQTVYMPKVEERWRRTG